MIELNDIQRQALGKGEAVRILAQDLGGEIVLLRCQDYDRIQTLLNDEREKAAWAGLARKAANRWAQENPF